MTLAVQPNPRLEYMTELRICVVQNLGVNICFPFYREVEINKSNTGGFLKITHTVSAALSYGPTRR